MRVQAKEDIVRHTGLDAGFIFRTNNKFFRSYRDQNFLFMLELFLYVFQRYAIAARKTERALPSSACGVSRAARERVQAFCIAKPCRRADSFRPKEHEIRVPRPAWPDGGSKQPPASLGLSYFREER